METVIRKDDLLIGTAAGVVGVAAMHYVATPIMYRNESASAFLREKKLQPMGLEAPHVAAAKLTGRQNYALGKGIEAIFGIAPAIAYKMFYKKKSALSLGKGLRYGFGLWVVVDEMIVPALGLSGPTRKYPWQAHARGLVGHLMFGLATHAAISFLDRKKI